MSHNTLMFALVLILSTSTVYSMPHRAINSSNLEKAQRLLEQNMLIDGHNDWPYMLRINFDNQLSRVNLTNISKEGLVANGGSTHTDILRLREGRVGGQFWAAYASCAGLGKDATLQHMEQLDVIRRFIDKHPDVFQFATTSEEMIQAFRSGKIASLIGLESGHAIDSSLGLLRMFYDLGVRYMTLTHNCDVPWATQNQRDIGQLVEQGLSDFGRKVIHEMNRLGMLVDISHVSYKTMVDVLNTTKVPVMFSHSSVYQLCPHTRNVRDDILLELKKNKGIIMINFYNGFIKCINQNTPVTPVTVDDVIDHFEYVKKIHNSTDFIGLGSDFDGVNGVPDGLDDVSYFPLLFARMLDKGWSEEDLIKIAGGNFLRVFSEVEKYARSLKEMDPINDIIPSQDLGQQFQTCRTSF